LEGRIPKDHPLRAIRALVNEVLAALSSRFEELYSHTGRPSIAPEYLLRATLLQAFFTVRSERQLMEQIDYNLLFRWFVGLSMDDAVWDASTSRRIAIGSWRPMWRGSSWPLCCRCRK
jgi:transposase